MKRPFGRGPTSRSLGDRTPWLWTTSKFWDDPPSRLLVLQNFQPSRVSPPHGYPTGPHLQKKSSKTPENGGKYRGGVPPSNIFTYIWLFCFFLLVTVGGKCTIHGSYRTSMKNHHPVGCYMLRLKCKSHPSYLAGENIFSDMGWNNHHPATLPETDILCEKQCFEKTFLSFWGQFKNFAVEFWECCIFSILPSRRLDLQICYKLGPFAALKRNGGRQI